VSIATTAVSEVKDFYEEWPLGTFILGFLIVALTLTLLVGVLWGLYIAVDSWSLATTTGPASVESRTFTPAHTASTYNAALKMPQTVYVPDDWSLCLKVHDQTGCTSVTHEVFDEHVEGDSVAATYATGRISGDLYIEDVEG